MVTYLYKFNLRNKNYKLVIFTENEKNKSNLKNDINIIFKNFNFKIIDLKIKNFNLFTLNNIFYWKKILLINKLNFLYLKNILIKKKINLNNYDEILYSNERSSNYINYMFTGKKIFFFHGIGDIKIFVKQNFLKKIKNSIFNQLNYNFNKIELPNQNSSVATIYKNFIKNKFIKKKIINLNVKVYKSYFNNFSQKKIKQINFKPKKNFIFYILKFPRFKVNEHNKGRTEYLINSLNFQFLKVSKFINKHHSLKTNDIIIKTKNNISYKESKIINKTAKNLFNFQKIYFLTNKRKSYINAEIFASHKKCKGIVSSLSSADFLTKLLNNHCKIFQYHEIMKFFNSNSEFYKIRNIDIKPSIIKKYYETKQDISI